ncbi:A-kinase anchor protein 9 [Latimeria chalumnae]|uniref:A-kinase anchor protein 9 n=1 Tax=Latimeria chalumnae TaxID=7897 RepID=UPI00313CFCB7
MASRKSLQETNVFSELWYENDEEDIYEVESRVPLPQPYFLSNGLNENNAVIVYTSISHNNRKEKGHSLRVVTKISLPTPPYTLQHAKATKTELMRESIKRKQQVGDLLKRQEELQEKLSEEAKAREQLALELHKAEGLLDGYTDEKVHLETQIQEKADLLRHLEQELHHTSSRLQELEEERQQLQQERELLSRQQEAMKKDAGPIELRMIDAAVDAAPKAELLGETEKLMKEKIEVQRQADKEHCDLQAQLKSMEVEMEEQVSRTIEMEQEKSAEIADLRQQLQALEKQLEKNRKFMDEQAIDREHERDVFQLEIQKLEQLLKTPQRMQPSIEHRNSEVEQLQNQLKEKTDRCSELLLGKEQLQRDVQERNEEIEKLESRIRELEQALIISADTLQKVEEKKQFTPLEVKGELTLEAQLQTERDALDRKEKEISNLEEQLEQFREELENKSEEVQQLHMQLEIQRKESSTHQQELEQENKSLKNEVENLRQSVQESGDVSIEDHRIVIGKFSQVLQDKDREIEQLHEEIAKLQQQLDIASDNKVIEEKNEQIKELETQIECLKSDQERLKRSNEEEVEQLNEVIEKLQQELANMDQKEPMDSMAVSEDAESLKHQLEIVMAEKKDLQLQVEKSGEEMGLTKEELKEKLVKIGEITEELETLKAKHNSFLEKYRCLQLESSVTISREDTGDEIKKLEETLREKTAAFLVNQAQIKALEENVQISVSTLNAKIEELKSTVKEKDLELSLCYNQIEQLKKQALSETGVLQREVFDAEETLKEKQAAVLVSQAELSDGQEQSKTSEPTQERPKELPTLAETTVPEKQTRAQLSILKTRIAEMEEQLAEAEKKFLSEKEQLKLSQKEAEDKGKKVAELQKLLEEMKGRKEEEQETSAVVTSKVKRGEARSRAVPDLLEELESLKVEAAASKEELNSYKERSEKLQEQLQVKEVTISQLQEEILHVKESLTQAEIKLSDNQQKKQLSQAEVNLIAPDKTDNASAKESPQLMRTDSTSRNEKPLMVHKSVQTTLIVHKDAEIQIDLLAKHSCSSSEEVAEVIQQYIDKIGQMQELHAAEIMDMEARHISETETLKSNHCATVQALQEEYNSVKAMIDTLRAKEGATSRFQQTSSQLKDGYTSDASSDWSQGAYFDIETRNQEFRTTPEGAMRESDLPQVSAEFLPDKIKNLLREVHQEGMQVLSLSELPYIEGQSESAVQYSEAWLQERQALLDTIQSLKDLITKMEVYKETQVSSSSSTLEKVPDWRGELFQAIQQVFMNEGDALMAALHTQLSTLSANDAVILLNRLEQQLQEQHVYQRASMDRLHSVDRKSLMSEIQELQARLNIASQGQNRPMSMEWAEEKSQGLQENKMQQKQSAKLEMQAELGSMKGKEGELLDQLNTERIKTAELKNELAQSKLELETTLKSQHKHFKELEALRLEVANKAVEVDRLNDALANEQKKTRELHWTLEKEKARLERNEEKEKEELEDLKFTLEDQKQKILQLDKLLDQEKQNVVELKQSMDSQQALHEAQVSHEQSRISELQILLDTEKARAVELTSALEREKELCSQLQKSPPEAAKSGEELLKELQSQLDEKHGRIVELVSEMERYKLEAVQAKQQMEEDKVLHRRALHREQDSNRLVQGNVDELQQKLKDLSQQLEETQQQILKFQQEKERLQETIQDLQERETEERREAEKVISQLDPNGAIWDTERSSDRTRNWVLQQKTATVNTKEPSGSPESETNGGGAVTGEGQVLNSIGQRLQLIASKLTSLASKAAGRLQLESTNDEDLIWLQNSIQDVVSQLHHLPALPAMAEQNVVLPSSGSSSSLIERLLRQNAELTGYVSRLTEEKNDLRNAVIKLEEEVRRYRQRGDYSAKRSLDGEDTVDTLFVNERERWAKEKVSLQRSLKQAEAELSKLRADVRSEALQRDLPGSDTENSNLKRIYGKYLRAESFRKALIYQKKYLLLLLGGFQECEQATLCLIARMGGHPSSTDLEVITHHSRGFTRFRSAVRVSIAISRMKFLVRRWQRVTRLSLAAANRNGFGQTTGNELRTESPYLQPGGLDRSRSGLESPRSSVNSHHRYQLTAVDASAGSLACSHLQSYDPDRALTDYINRLESLQRRLGSVQSGSTSYAQLHYGMRR